MENNGSILLQNLWGDHLPNQSEDSSSPNDIVVAEVNLLKLDDSTVRSMFSQVAAGDDADQLFATQLCFVTDDAESVLSDNSSNKLTAQENSTSFDDLPTELVIRILSMLPVKALIQSTTVCKLWYAIIKDPNFISSHLSCSISDPSRHAVLLTLIKLGMFPENRKFSVFRENNGSLTHHYDLGIPFETRNGDIEIIGSCNGVLCITEWTARTGAGLDIFLLNPSINKYKKLDGKFSSFGNLFKKMLEEDYFIAMNGFGYYEPEDDYRVVRIICFKDPTLGHLVEVFSLKTGMWKSIKASVDIQFGDGIQHVFVDGCLYWLAFRQSDEPTIFLQSFDLKEEVFHKIELPPNVDPFVIHNVIEIRGSVCVCTMVPINGTPPILRTNFLVMERNSSGDVQWKALNCLDIEWKDFKYKYIEEYGISPFRALGISANGKLVVDERSRKRWFPTIIALDLHNNGAVERLADEALVTVDPCYVESLVLLSE